MYTRKLFFCINFIHKILSKLDFYRIFPWSMHHMARKGSCFSDLNISVEGDKKCIGRILERLAECKLAKSSLRNIQSRTKCLDGYERVALNEDICLVKKANVGIQRIHICLFYILLIPSACVRSSEQHVSSVKLLTKYRSRL